MLTWDAENRLTSAVSLTNTPVASQRKVEWQFDGKGRRIRQTTYDGSSGSCAVTEDLKFISDGWRHIAELNATNNALIRSYTWGLDLSGSMDGAGGVGGLLMMNSVANGAHFYAYDGNGNVAVLVKASDGTVSANYEYEAFGKPIRATGLMAKENPFRFSTKRTDNTTDLVLYEMRPYSPSLGRWPNRDPIGEQGGLNLYGFARNDPCNYWDNDGRFTYSIHYNITHDAAINAGYSSKCAGKIARATADTDIWHPLDDSYHFTRHVRGDKAAALQASEENRDNLLNEASEHGQKRQCWRALKDLGRGLHVLEDYYSHVINGEPVSFSITGNYPPDDRPDHKHDARDTDPAAAENARQAAQSKLSALWGSFSCCCSK
jgi:RHS repeat-associated protein